MAPTVICLCFLHITAVVSHNSYQVPLHETVDIHVKFNIQALVLTFALVNLLFVLPSFLEVEVRCVNDLCAYCIYTWSLEKCEL